MLAAFRAAWVDSETSSDDVGNDAADLCLACDQEAAGFGAGLRRDFECVQHVAGRDAA
jgi:hypothetical protein